MTAKTYVILQYSSSFTSIGQFRDCHTILEKNKLITKFDYEKICKKRLHTLPSTIKLMRTNDIQLK